jgi:dolichol-phosphate mannosyltransferase
MRRYSQLQVDEGAYDTRIISRRALNSLLRLRENLRYMKAIYSLVGFPTTSLTLEAPFKELDRAGFSERFRTSLVAITSFTSFLRSVLLGVFLTSFLFLIVVIINALLVRFTGYDILGNPEEVVKGWTFLVVLISLFFAANFLILYIMSVYLSNIYQEIKQRPLYIIESIKRF